MPTGYTAQIKDGQTFEDFVWTCARAFGALVLMRDDSLDAEIPTRLEPDERHLRQVKEARLKLDLLAHMSDEETQRRADREYHEEIAANERHTTEIAELRAKYESMIKQVENWEPPSEDHDELKKFMLQQLNESLKWDCAPDQTEIKHRSGPDWKERRRARLLEDIDWYSKEYANEVRRTSERNTWLAQLQMSVPYRKKRT